MLAREKIFTQETRPAAIRKVLTVPNVGIAAPSFFLLKSPYSTRHPRTAGLNNSLSIYTVTFLGLFSRWTSWTPCKTNSVESATSQLPDSTLEPLPARAANLSLVALVTIRVSFRNARIITDVSSTRKIELHAKPAGCENV